MKNLSSDSITRRQFAQLMLAAAVSQTVVGCVGSSTASRDSMSQAWLSADEIKQLTRLPKFAEQDFKIEHYGAIGDGKTDCAAAIAAAIDDCAGAGGGRVVCAQGVYKTGPIHLKSNVNLYIDAAAELSFFTDPKRYLPPVFSRWEGMEMYGYSPLVYAYQQENIALTGAGKLNGNANNETWWPWKGDHEERHWQHDPEQVQQPARQKLFDMTEAGRPVSERIFAEGSYLRPAFVQFYRCRRVLIENVTIMAAPFWLLHPVLSEDVTIRGVTCSSHGPNSDGCDPESCNRVVIENCVFDTGDDCIAVKSGRNNDGRRIAEPSRNILIQNCTMRAGHGGIVLGSEISGGVQNLHARNCEMSSPDLERAIRIKTNASRGGTIEHIRYDNIRVGQVQDAVVVNFYYEEGPDGDFPPTVRDVVITNLQVARAERAFMLRGFPDNPVTGLTLSDCDIAQATSLGVIENVSQIQLQAVRVNGEAVTAESLVL